MTAPAGAAHAPPRQSFLGVPFTPLTLDQALAAATGRPPGLPFAYVVTPNAQHTVGVDRGDQRFIRPIAGAWLVLNDSRVLRLLARRAFGFDLPLATGADLTLELVSRRLDPATPITLIGGSDAVEQRLRDRFGLKAIARHNPPMGFWRDPEEVDRCARFVVANPARYVFFIVGSPQSEMTALRVAEQGGATGLGLCVGGAMNFATGLVKRTPEPIRRLNLEWAYRLAQNPVGHFRRVFLESFPVLAVAARAWLRGRDRA